MASADLRELHANVVLQPLTTLDVGGSARWFARARTIQDVVAADRWAAERGADLFVLGGGSNVVIADEGFSGLVLQIRIAGRRLRTEGAATIVEFGAGEEWDTVVALAVERGLAGVECLSGIPGTVGGTPIQNVGAYGQEVADTIDTVTVIDRSSQEMVDLPARECGFTYRQSRFKQRDAGRFIVCRVAFRLKAGPPTITYPDVIAYVEQRGWREPTVSHVRDAVLAIRRAKGMVIDPVDPDTRSVGSFFMNPVVSAARHQDIARGAGGKTPAFRMASGEVKIPAAWLIERAGFAKGYGAGRVGLSSKHPLALINRGGAAARDVIALATEIKRRVLDRFGVWLRPEPIFVGFGADPAVEFLRKANG